MTTVPADTYPARQGGWVRRDPAGAALVLGVSALVLLIMSPVVVQGGLLADEYLICLRPIHDGGYGPYLRHIWQDTGVVRPARFIELFLIATTCTSVPFGLVMLVPLALKFAASALLYGLLRDLRAPAPWPAIGAAIWLLEPVGTEAALWPAALHVVLGLVLCLAALRLFARGSLAWAALASFGACLSVEQVIFALPLAVWVTSPPAMRRRATVTAIVVVSTVILAYATFPGENERQALTLAERWQNIFAKGAWYVFFPAAGLGLYSGAFGFLWALPYSIAVVVAGAVLGSVLIPRLLARHAAFGAERWLTVDAVLAFGALLVLVNLPMIVTEVGYSARTFTPTWLLLSGAAAVGGARVAWRRPARVGVLAGTWAAFVVLSLSLSVSVRVRTETFNRAAAQWIAERTEDGAVVAVCDVGRTVVEPAPLGAFHLHELHWPTGAWVEYLTGRSVEIRRSGDRYWGSRCPDLEGADLVVDFPQLVAELSRGEGVTKRRVATAPPR